VARISCIRAEHPERIHSGVIAPGRLRLCDGESRDEKKNNGNPTAAAESSMQPHSSQIRQDKAPSIRWGSKPVDQLLLGVITHLQSAVSHDRGGSVDPPRRAFNSRAYTFVLATTSSSKERSSCLRKP
jgi:hypothetical protein